MSKLKLIFKYNTIHEKEANFYGLILLKFKE